MSNRSLLEFNHDHGPYIHADKDVLAWARHIIEYLRTGDEEKLPYGVVLKHKRHHSEPEPIRYDDHRIERAMQAMTDILALSNAPGRYSIRAIAEVAMRDLGAPICSTAGVEEILP